MKDSSFAQFLAIVDRQIAFKLLEASINTLHSASFIAIGYLAFNAFISCLHGLKDGVYLINLAYFNKFVYTLKAMRVAIEPPPPPTPHSLSHSLFLPRSFSLHRKTSDEFGGVHSVPTPVGIKRTNFRDSLLCMKMFDAYRASNKCPL